MEPNKKNLKGWDMAVDVARFAFNQYVEGLLEEKDPEKDQPLPHVYHIDRDDKMTVFALMIVDNPGVNEYMRNLRATMQAKILLEGVQASVYCGWVIQSPTIPPGLEKLALELKRTRPFDFLEVLAKEHGIQNTNAVVAVAESGLHSFTVKREFYIRDKVVCFTEPTQESHDQEVPWTPWTRFRWPARMARTASVM
jgi:hypothetical protein